MKELKEKDLILDLKDSDYDKKITSAKNDNNKKSFHDIMNKFDVTTIDTEKRISEQEWSERKIRIYHIIDKILSVNKEKISTSIDLLRKKLKDETEIMREKEISKFMTSSLRKVVLSHLLNKNQSLFSKLKEDHFDFVNKAVCMIILTRNNELSGEFTPRIMEVIKTSRFFDSTGQREIKTIKENLNNTMIPSYSESHYNQFLSKKKLEVKDEVQKYIELNRITNPNNEDLNNLYIHLKYNTDVLLGTSTHERHVILPNLIKEELGLKEKMCPKCGQKKNFNEFEDRPDRPGRKFSHCEGCRLEYMSNQNEITSISNKIKAILYLMKKYNSITPCLSGFCQTEKFFVENLPSYDFHHLDKKGKSQKSKRTGVWKSMYTNPWEKIKDRIDKEFLETHCRNCHRIEEAHRFREFKKAILDSDLDSKLGTFTRYERTIIRYHLKKKELLLDLFGGKCQVCGSGISNSNIDLLPALELHHTDNSIFPEIKKIYLNQMLGWSNMDRIKKEVQNQKMTCICSNCHAMLIAPRFKDSLDEIKTIYKKLRQKEIQY